jgi:hypothetical protein
MATAVVGEAFTPLGRPTIWQSIKPLIKVDADAVCCRSIQLTCSLTFQPSMHACYTSVRVQGTLLQPQNRRAQLCESSVLELEQCKQFMCGRRRRQPQGSSTSLLAHCPPNCRPPSTSKPHTCNPHFQTAIHAYITAVAAGFLLTPRA